jgi:hypothetical protein
LKAEAIGQSEAEMNNSKVHLALRLAAVFAASFLTVFLVIFFTQSTYSTPSSYVSVINDMDITVGPPPNSTNIPLDTTITVDALASASLNDLHLTPEVPIASRYSQVTSSVTYINTFYPAEPLEPATPYTVSVTVLNEPLSWSFTTTSEPFSPNISYILATNVLWISLSAATSATLIAGFAIWLKKKTGFEPSP